MPLSGISSLPLLLIALAAIAWACQSQFDATSRKSPAVKDTCPDSVASTGKYTNNSFGFSVTIPKQLRGFWNSARCSDESDGCICMSDHGRTIPLTSESLHRERYIEIYAGYVADLNDTTVSSEVAKQIETIRQESLPHPIAISKQIDITLAGIPAKRAVVRYYDRTPKGWLIEDLIESLHGEVEYVLYLRTPEDSYPHDRPILDRVVGSFVLSK